MQRSSYGRSDGTATARLLATRTAQPGLEKRTARLTCVEGPLKLSLVRRIVEIVPGDQTFRNDIRYTTGHKQANKYANLIYIYGIADPRDHLIRYVGKTECSLGMRLSWHLKRPVNWRMGVWLKSLAELCVRPEIAVIELCRRNAWEAREAHWIRKLRENLLNISPGEPIPEKTRPLGRNGRRTMRIAKLEAIEIADRSGPVKVLTRDEISSLFPGSAVSKA